MKYSLVHLNPTLFFLSRKSGSFGEAYSNSEKLILVEDFFKAFLSRLLARLRRSGVKVKHNCCNFSLQLNRLHQTTRCENTLNQSCTSSRKLVKFWLIYKGFHQILYRLIRSLEQPVYCCLTQHSTQRQKTFLHIARSTTKHKKRVIQSETHFHWTHVDM